MAYIRNIFAAIAIAMASSSVYAIELPTTNVAGVPCYYYDVQPKETIYSVAEALGITRTDIIKFNPAVADGLRPGTRLYFPVSTLSKSASITAIKESEPAEQTPVAETIAEEPVSAYTDTADASPTEDVYNEDSADGQSTVTHTVRRGESIYGISRKYGVPMERIIALNPSAENGVRNGDTLLIPLKADDETVPGSNPHGITLLAARDGYDVYQIQPGETLPRIAAGRNLSLDGLLADNPHLDGLSDYTGAFIYVPRSYSLIPSENRLNDRLETTYVPAEPLNIAIILPFMLGEDEQSKTAQLFTEFYKGFLLAADSLSTPDNRQINIYAYDSAASADTIREIIRRPEFTTMNLIIAPDNEEHLRIIADGAHSDTYILNVFNARNELQNSYRNMIQTNIPHTAMYDKAIDGIRARYPDHTPVFLARIDGSADKDAFISRLKTRLDADSCEYLDITYRNLLSDKDLEQLPEGRDYIFIPVSGVRAEFAKITGSLKRLRERPEARSVVLFGYPEWITFRGDYYNRLGELNATIYTRFYANAGDHATEDFSKKYRLTYGTDMLDAVPNQGMLGFDTGMFAISALRDNGGDFHSSALSRQGLQNDYELSDENIPGLVNNSLLFVTFDDGGFISKVNL